MPAIREPLTNEDLWDWDRMTAALAATEAWWEPGTRHAYHTNTYGHLVGEVVRRVEGETAGTTAGAPWPTRSAPTCTFGVPPSEQHRCAEVHLRLALGTRWRSDDALDRRSPAWRC